MIRKSKGAKHAATALLAGLIGLSALEGNRLLEHSLKKKEIAKQQAIVQAQNETLVVALKSKGVEHPDYFRRADFTPKESAKLLALSAGTIDFLGETLQLGGPDVDLFMIRNRLGMARLTLGMQTKGAEIFAINGLSNKVRKNLPYLDSRDPTLLKDSFTLKNLRKLPQNVTKGASSKSLKPIKETFYELRPTEKYESLNYLGNALIREYKFWSGNISSINENLRAYLNRTDPEERKRFERFISEFKSVFPPN